MVERAGEGLEDFMVENRPEMAVRPYIHMVDLEGLGLREVLVRTSVSMPQLDMEA